MSASLRGGYHENKRGRSQRSWRPEATLSPGIDSYRVFHHALNAKRLQLLVVVNFDIITLDAFLAHFLHDAVLLNVKTHGEGDERQKKERMNENEDGQKEEEEGKRGRAEGRRRGGKLLTVKEEERRERRKEGNGRRARRSEKKGR